MSVLLDLFTAACILSGVVFFVAGAAGLLRFPDTLSRLHALGKADNLGLGLIALGLVPRAPDLAAAAKLVAIWLLAQLSAATVTQLMARAALRRGGAGPLP